jgi:hypothetical protein
LDRRLGGPQSFSEHGGEEKNSQPLPGLEPPIIQPVAQRCSGYYCLIRSFNNLCVWPNIIRIIKSRKLRWAVHVALMGDVRNV